MALVTAPKEDFRHASRLRLAQLHSRPEILVAQKNADPPGLDPHLPCLQDRVGQVALGVGREQKTNGVVGAVHFDRCSLSDKESCAEEEGNSRRCHALLYVGS